MSRQIKILALAVFAGACGAADLGAVGVGTTGADFLKVGVGARPLAMGGAFSALADDANAINWNPGALGTIKERNVTASYNSLFKDENQGFLGYVAPLSDNMGVVGAGINYLMVSNIEKRAGDTETPDSTFTNQNFAINASYGRALGEAVSVGGNLKFIREKLDSFNGNAVAIDAGATYKTRIENLSTGVSLQNLGTKIGPDPLPMTVKGGAAYKMLGQKLIVASDLDWRAVDQRTYWDLGAEGWVNRILAVRAGYQFGHGQDQLGSRLVGASFGIGLWVDKFRLDYAFLPFGNLGDTHRITLGWSF